MAGIVIGSVSTGFVFAQSDESYVKQFVVKAFRYGFDPEVIVVNQGDIVVITVESVDAVHGFYIEDYEIREDYIVPRSPRTISFVADRMGMFRIHCSTICGPLHPFMMGQLVVQPSIRFIATAIGASSLSIGFIAFLLVRKENKNE
jgi:cytochrome c oxidase subunit 2